MIRTAWLSIMIAFSVIWGAADLFAEVSEEDVIAASHKALAKDGALPKEWTFYIDKELQRWHHIKSLWQKASARERQLGRDDTEFGPWLEQMEAAIAGKHVWAVVYKLILPPGERAFHPNAMVLVDADSGRVLAFIEPEGVPHFLK